MELISFGQVSEAVAQLKSTVDTLVDAVAELELRVKELEEKVSK